MLELKGLACAGIGRQARLRAWKNAFFIVKDKRARAGIGRQARLRAWYLQGCERSSRSGRTINLTKVLYWWWIVTSYVKSFFIF